MWWWTVFCLLIFYGQISSQPVTDESENARQARQLDFGECCPCPGPGQDFAAQESMLTGGGMFARARDIDDCPCRARSPDSEGASSIFFPTSSRSDGDFVKAADKKEDFKPLLHPEVDLASSVLETLREATDEEYQDALARDAARSMAKAAEETTFGDSVPEASNGNIVTIIVNPKQTESLNDVIPQETHVQESRCIHVPLESASPNLGQMRAQKPPSLLREIFGLPRISKSTGLMHRNLLDMDNGASNIQERVENDQSTTKSVLGLRKYAPLMKVDSNIEDKSTKMKSDVDVDTSVKKVPDSKLPAMKNKLKDLLSNIPKLEDKDETNSLPLIPKLKLNNPLLNVKGKNEEDLSLSPSNIHEQAKKNFFQTKSHLENILENPRTVNLKTLLKLKDVEFVPLKNLIPIAAESSTLNKPKFVWPDLFNKEDNVISSIKDKHLKTLDKTTEILEKIPISSKDETFDAEVSPSNVIDKITDDNCKNGATETDGEDTEAKIAEMIDTASSPSEIQEIVSDTTQNFANNQSNELPDNTDDCNVKTLPDTEINLPQSQESSFENEAQGTNEEINFVTSKETTPENSREEEDPESEFVTNDEDCVSNNNNADLVTDSSTNTNDVLEPNDTVLENVDDSFVNKTPETQEPCSQELPSSDTSKTFDINTTKSIVPLSLHKSVSTIKENIRKHIENLKKSNSKHSENFDSPNSSDIIENKEPPITDEKLNSNCENEESIQITTVIPDICDDNLKIENEPDDDKVSMQDLQKISDEMLQEEQERESKTLNCSEPTREVTDSNIPIEEKSVDNENVDSEQSANSQNEIIMDPQNIVNFVDQNDNKIKNTCRSDLISPKQSFGQESDANVAASEVIFNRTPQKNDIFESPLLLNKVLQPNENDFSLNIPLPDIQGIKLEPLPTLDEIKYSLSNLFDKPARDVEEHSASEAASMTDTSNILSPIMSTDASAKHFQSMLRPLILEDINLDILQLKPQSNLFSKLPAVDLHSLKKKLPLPTGLRIKPINLKSAFEDKGGLLGDTLSLGQNNPWETIPNLNDFGTRLKANTQKIAKTLRKPSLRHNLKLGQGIGDLSDSKHSLKSMQHTLESKIRGATIKPVNLQTNDLFEAISRNHEDVNDKLKALHVDFNDRLETMRSNLFDKSIFGSGESRSTKSSSTFSNKNKDKKISLKTTQPQSLSRTKESKTSLKPRRLERQRETRIGSSHGLQNNFKMPIAASVPVPRTIEVPELKATLTKLPGLGIQRASGVNPIFQSIDASQPKESSVTLWKQASKKLPVTNTRLGKTINPFKDSKIKVSFSTTPRPTLSSRLQSRKLSTPSSLSLTGKNTGRFGQKFDHSGSPSEIKKSIISPPISNHLDLQNFENEGLESESRQTGALSTRKLGGRENLEQPKMSKDLQSWPKVSESAFLSKVKDAVRARMAKVNSPVILKQTDIQPVSSSLGDNGETRHLNTDMARSASTNIDVIEGQALKENVSYKCTMVCTKE